MDNRENPNMNNRSITTMPTNVAAHALDASNIRITWNAVAGATGYRVFRSTTPVSYTHLLINKTSNFPSFIETSCSLSLITPPTDVVLLTAPKIKFPSIFCSST